MKKRRTPSRTTALFFPFDLFGSAGSRNGAHLLADAFREMIEDNKRERLATRADTYAGKVSMHEFALDTMLANQKWRGAAREAIHKALQKGDLLLWVTGNHLGVLPFYDELGARPSDSLVIQFDAHLDIYNLCDCTAELSHGNFLRHVEKLPRIVNVGTRELLLRPTYIRRYYEQTHAAAAIALDPRPALCAVREACRAAERVFLDIDCDVFDPA